MKNGKIYWNVWLNCEGYISAIGHMFRFYWEKKYIYFYFRATHIFLECVPSSVRAVFVMYTWHEYSQSPSSCLHIQCVYKTVGSVSFEFPSV